MAKGETLEVDGVTCEYFRGRWDSRIIAVGWKRDEAFGEGSIIFEEGNGVFFETKRLIHFWLDKKDGSGIFRTRIFRKANILFVKKAKKGREESPWTELLSL